MEVAELEETLQAFQSALTQAKWRLKPASRRRLETDILALCTGMRPVIMIDYGGKMPELQDRLCTFLKLCHKESSSFQNLQVMVIDDMIYLVHVIGLRELANASLNLEKELFFVDLEHDPPKIITKEGSSVVMQLIEVQKSFSLVFSSDEKCNRLLHCQGTDSTAGAGSSLAEPVTPWPSEYIDLSSCVQQNEVTIPTLNGWLLGYPVVYLFGKQHVEEAIYNLSTKSLHLFKILVSRNGNSSTGSQQEELMSFTVPYELSLEGSNEPWAEAFLGRMVARWERCKHVWNSLKMEVKGCYPQAIVL